MNDKFWYVAIGGQQQGLWTQDEVMDGIRSGRYGRDAYVFVQFWEIWASW